MASIKDIMNVDADQQGPPPTNNKKDKDSGTPASGTRGHDPSTSSTQSSHVNRSGQHNERNTSPVASQGKRRTASSRVSRSAAAASSSSRSTASRRRDTTSADSMDQSGYGSASASSMGGLGGGGGGGGGMNPNYPTRPMPHTTAGDIPVKLTPITGRVSRAKKGVPVHTCELCKPPKTFTRAEHLRRHQLSHQTPGYPCTYPGCDRTFHRPDLLARHQQRHEQEGDRASMLGGDDGSRRTSSASVSASLDERMPKLGLQPPPGFSTNAAGLGGTSTPSTSTSDMPSTPNMQHNTAAYPQGTSPGSATGSTMSPPMTGGEHYGHPVGGNRPSQGGYGGSSYELASTIPVIQQPPNLGTAPTFNNVDYHQPRNPPAIPLFLVTQNLSPTSMQMAEGPPELLHTQDASPWTSASDNSTYSTPSETLNRPARYWGVSTRRHQSPNSTDWHAAPSLLSPYPPPPQRDVHNPSGGLEAMSAPYYYNHTFPTSPHIPSSRHPTYGSMLDMPITTGFADDQTHHVLMDPTSQSHHYNPNSSVRSPTPPPSSIATSTQSAETLVTPAAALPADRISLMAQLGRQKEVAIGGVDVGMGGIFGMSGGNSPNWGSSSPGASILAMPGLGSMGACMPGLAMVMPLQRTVRNAIPSYLEVYWTRFHDVYPIVHRRSMEGSGEDVLRCAMAAIATQFFEGKEDRVRGNLLHEYAWQEAKRYPQWTLPVMQAILLCELFARFRGRKAVTRPSKPFESLYSRVLEHNTTLWNPAPMDTMIMTKEERWHTWLDAEARRRLLTACFVIDAHTAIYHEQPRMRTFDLRNDIPIPLTGPSKDLWEAQSADEWAAILDANPAAGSPQFLPPSDTLTPENIAVRPAFDRLAILAAEAMRLPRQPLLNLDTSPLLGTPEPGADPAGQDFMAATASASIQAEERINYLFPNSPTANAYLALHHTPLHDLLAVSGDSWVFSQKVLHPTSFLEHQKRLKVWAEKHARGGNLSLSKPGSGSSSASGNAVGDSTPFTMSAPKATVFAARALVAFLSPSDNGPSPWQMACISDYWALYVCALICWAFGHRAARGNDANRATNTSYDEALAWLRVVAEMQPEDVFRVRGRREVIGVVSLVRRRLEVDCVGGRSRLYVDAVGVLRKLEEGVNWKWF